MNHWTAFTNFIVWLMSWAGDTDFILNYNCNEASGFIRISYENLNSVMREVLDDRLKEFDKFNDIYIGMDDTHYTIYCKGYEMG